jgi:hypothetical protein
MVLAKKFVKSAAKYIVEMQGFLMLNNAAGDAAFDVGQAEAWIAAAILTGLEFGIDFCKEKFGWKWL